MRVDGSPEPSPAIGDAARVSVLLAGATGLVGAECLARLATDARFARVVVPTRRPLPGLPDRAPGAPVVEERLVDFEHLEPHAELFAVDAVICALGTTIRAAGSKARFRAVDFGYPATMARLAVERGARHFLLVSALGASAGSWVFYNRVKGEIEETVRALPYRSVTIVRPSLLLGDRAEFRLGEEVGKRLAWLAPPKYRPVHAGQVAAALARAVVEDRPGVRVVESREIPALAATYEGAHGE